MTYPPATAEALIELMTCPTDWYSITGYEKELDLGPLKRFWAYMLEKNSVSPYEVGPARDLAIYGEVVGPDFGDEESRYSIVRNLVDRRPKVINDYESTLGRVASLRFLDPLDHGKHQFPGSISEAIRLSRLGASRFSLSVSGERLANAFWEWLVQGFSFEREDDYDLLFSETASPDRPEAYLRQDLWRRLMLESHLRVAVELRQVIGYVNAEPTRFLCLDCHMDARIGHAYPIYESEAISIMKGVPIVYLPSF